MRTSEGIVAIGHGRAVECSVGGGTADILEVEKDAINSKIVILRGSSWEWWAGFCTVTATPDGLVLMGFETIEEGGKCLFLYTLSTPASSCVLCHQLPNKIN